MHLNRSSPARGSRTITADFDRRATEQITEWGRQLGTPQVSEWTPVRVAVSPAREEAGEGGGYVKINDVRFGRPGCGDAAGRIARSTPALARRHPRPV